MYSDGKLYVVGLNELASMGIGDNARTIPQDYPIEIPFFQSLRTRHIAKVRENQQKGYKILYSIL